MHSLLAFLVLCGSVSQQPTAPVDRRAAESHATTPASASVGSSTASGPSDRASGAKPLGAALTRANTAVRRAKSPADRLEAAKAELESEFACEATITDIQTDAAGKQVIVAETTVSRSVTLATRAGDETIRSATAAVTAARSRAEASLRKFEGGWRPLKANPSMYRVTHWGGCQKYWPRITADAYAQKRNAVIAEGNQSIAAAEAALQATRTRIRDERQLAQIAARTVRLVLHQGDSSTQVKTGQRVEVTFRINAVEIMNDPPTIQNPVHYVGCVHGVAQSSFRLASK